MHMEEKEGCFHHHPSKCLNESLGQTMAAQKPCIAGTAGFWLGRGLCKLHQQKHLKILFSKFDFLEGSFAQGRAAN